MKVTPYFPEYPPTALQLPLQTHGVAAGFPSPADDYVENTLDLNEYLIHHPSASYYARADGDSMNGLGIYDKDLLIIDRALTPQHGDVVIAAINGELCCKILDTRHYRLLSANPSYPPIPLNPDDELILEGVVIHAIHHLRPR